MPEATLKTLAMRPDQVMLGGDVGRVTVNATIENLADVFEVESGSRTGDQARRVEVPDALVDTGCTLVGLPASMIQNLGLKAQYRRPVRSATGLGETTVYGVIRLTIQGRSCSTDVFEVPDGVPVLIGQVPLEQLDFVVDLKRRRLEGNPDHQGEWVLDGY